jgi:hypothetical protein
MGRDKLKADISVADGELKIEKSDILGPMGKVDGS